MTPQSHDSASQRALPELIACPFCGGKAAFHRKAGHVSLEDNDDGAEWIECAQCSASTPLSFSIGEDCKPVLAERWNRRATAPSAERESLEAEATAEGFESLAAYVANLKTSASTYFAERNQARDVVRQYRAARESQGAGGSLLSLLA